MAEGGPAGQHDDLAKVLSAIEKYQVEIDEDAEMRDGIRAVVRELEKASKKMNYTIFSIHSTPSEENLKYTGLKLKEELKVLVQPLIATLKEKVPKGEYYKYNDHYKHTLQRLAYASLLSNYLLNQTICSIAETAGLIGLKPVKENGDESLILDYDDYLLGLLELASEFSRFCRNCVTFGGDINRVYSIHETMNRINAGMHNIVFKNDHLRRRYDGLKYHIKAVEEVIYDLKIRGISGDLKNVTSADPDEKTE